MTIEIPANREDCFYLPDLKIGNTIELEFQVYIYIYFVNVRYDDFEEEETKHSPKSLIFSHLYILQFYISIS